MSLSKHISTCLMVCSFTLAFAALTTTHCHAQTPALASVETYANQANPTTNVPGIDPEGFTWNHPMKAGDMVLPRLNEPTPDKIKKKESALTAGKLKAPLLPIGKNEAKAPRLSSGKNSTQSIMLIQGLKSALKQAGQNTDIPKSDMNVGPELDTTTTATTLSQEIDGLPFVKGEEPKTFGEVLKKGKTSSDDALSDIIFPEEMTKDASTETVTSAERTPKATELKEQPLPLEAMPTPTHQEKKERGFFEKLATPFDSIFGAPVSDEESKTNKQELAQNTNDCTQTITKWKRECAASGYPTHFVGEIVGETRIECPSGTAKDVWLSNNCAAPIASSNLTIQSKPDAANEPPSALLSASPVGMGVIVPDAETASDGACGTANGLASTNKPTADLCSQGQATDVLGDGPWHWSCKGQQDGISVSCAAPVAPQKESMLLKKITEQSSEALTQIEDGKCGASANTGSTESPTTQLCTQGTPSRVNGAGPWSWACGGLNGGTAVACSAPKKIDGLCGSASDLGTDSMPMRDLCVAGYASAVTGDGPWNWTCSGLYGGEASTCSAQKKVNAICGKASIKGQRAAPTENLCSAGNASEVIGLGPWDWTCTGSGGGAKVQCNAQLMRDGQCGPAHGNQYTKPPLQGLCNQGMATRVTGVGPWNWNCSGSEGGLTVSCTANLASKEAVAAVVSCGESTETLQFSKPTDNLCRAGNPSDVKGTGPWTWNCSDDASHTVKCSTLTASDGECGSAASIKTVLEPTNDLCNSGTPSKVESDNRNWKWNCEGILNGKTATCVAPADISPIAITKPEPPVAPQVACGDANGNGFTKTPKKDLCEVGKASKVKGSGPWNWTCSDKKTKVSCEAPKIVEGRCGRVNGSVQKHTPTSGLCSSGEPTEVTGTGPWMWSCIGAGGGDSSSCSASAQSQTIVDGTCGQAANALMNKAPEKDLCDSGVPSPVYGTGPWTWTCSGMNNGIASTCTTSFQRPQAPLPPGPIVNGVCGYSNGVTAAETPTQGLCSAGTETPLSGNGPWNWSCIGANGGMTVSCTAPLMPPPPIVGTCGSASGTPTLTTPVSGLCSSGIASAVNGKGPWTWSCSGTNGGGAVSCVAPLAGNRSSTQPLPSLVTPSAISNEAPAPQPAPVGLVTPQISQSQSLLPAIKSEKKPAELTTPQLSSNTIIGDGLEAETPPPIRDEIVPTPGVEDPILDSDGRIPPGAKLRLEPELSNISFASGSDQLDEDSIETVEKLVTALRANPQARVTLIAYAGTDSQISPRKARRLSLNRALSIRDFMTSKGIPSSRVDVRPMGANVPSGDMDRVDVVVN